MRAKTVLSLDTPQVFNLVAADPEAVLQVPRPVFIDEWQLVPNVWNTIRHAVDDGADPGSFILAGSFAPAKDARLHSGAGRFVRLTMRPMNLCERGFSEGTISLKSLLDGERPAVEGGTELRLWDYAEEIMRSGLPGVRAIGDAEVRYEVLDGYVSYIVDHEVAKAGTQVRRPRALLGWLKAYAAATGTTATYSSILNAATSGEESKPARATAISYRDLLQRMWVLDPLEAWLPGGTHLKRLGQSPKHHLVDPALAAVLVGANEKTLLQGEGPARDGTFLGSLFESLAVQHVRTLAAANRAETFHMRTQGGDHEVDMIVSRRDGKVVAIETKLSSEVRPADVRQLNWLESEAPELVIDKVLLNTGKYAYRRKDGVAVIPLGMLGV